MKLTDLSFSLWYLTRKVEHFRAERTPFETLEGVSRTLLVSLAMLLHGASTRGLREFRRLPQGFAFRDCSRIPVARDAKQSVLAAHTQGAKVPAMGRQVKTLYVISLLRFPLSFCSHRVERMIGNSHVVNQRTETNYHFDAGRLSHVHI